MPSLFSASGFFFQGIVVAAINVKSKTFRDNCEVAFRLPEFITQKVLREASTFLLTLILLVLGAYSPRDLFDTSTEVTFWRAEGRNSKNEGAF